MTIILIIFFFTACLISIVATTAALLNYDIDNAIEEYFKSLKNKFNNKKQK